MKNIDTDNKWDKYADAYNDLAIHMKEAGIETDKLKCLLNLYREYILNTLN